MDKKVLTWLRKECEKLPSKTYKAAHKYSKPILKEAEEGKDPRWILGYLDDHEVNHYRRCKKLFKKFGIEAVHAYFYIIGGMVPLKPQQNESSNNTED